jgi:galactokinase
MTSVSARIAAALAGEDRRWFQAPGRVNLIGEHTDYNEGFVLPLAIDRACVIAVARGSDPGHGLEGAADAAASAVSSKGRAEARHVRSLTPATVRVRSLDAEGSVEIPADGRAEPRVVEPAWGRYVAGVVRELATRGRPATGLDAVLASDVPLGAGLSSSAALEVAVAVALARLAEWEIGVVELADACRVAERKATGVPVGIMDQLVSLAGVEGAALLIDCRSLERRPVPLPPEIAVLVVHSGVSRDLAEGAYAERRRACEELAQELGLRSLRDATEEQVASNPFGRHVVSENRRVLEAVEALEARDLETLGRLLNESHASMRDDFRISTPELDVLVEELRRAGAYGARLTGGGFGGCAVALCPVPRVDEIAEAATQRYRAATGREPRMFVCRPVGGAGEMHFPHGAT